MNYWTMIQSNTGQMALIASGARNLNGMLKVFITLLTSGARNWKKQTHRKHIFYRSITKERVSLRVDRFLLNNVSDEVGEAYPIPTMILEYWKMSENNFIGFIHWPRLWAVNPPNIRNFVPKTLNEIVWEGTVGQQEITLKIRQEGSFLFDLGSYRDGILAPIQDDNIDIDAIISTDGKRCDFFNTYLYCLYTCFHSEQNRSQEKMTVKTKSLVLEGELCLSAKQDELTIVLTQASYQSTYHPCLPKFVDFRVRTAPNWYVNDQTLNATAELFSQILNHEESDAIIQLCSLQLQAYVSAEQHMYRHSLAHAFMVSEFIVDQEYRIPDNRDDFFQKIKKLCADGYSLPICAPCRTNFKESKAKCDSPMPTRETLDKGDICINRVRLNRNEWMHDHSEISETAAIEAIRVSEALIEIHYGIKLTASVECSTAVW